MVLGLLDQLQISDSHYTVMEKQWSRKCLVDFNTGKTQLVLFDRSNNTGAILITLVLLM